MLRRTLRAGALGGIALLAGGCEEDTEYSYVKVSVKIADTASPDFLARIAACGVNVVDTSGAILDFSSINCQEGQVRSHQLGVVDWSTVEGGTVRFVVTLKDRATREIGKGMSRNITVVKNGVVNESMQVDPLPDPMMTTDGGAPADGGAALDTNLPADVGAADTGGADAGVTDAAGDGG